MSLLYMKSFRESEGSRRTTKTGGFGSSLFSKKFSSSSLGQNPHAQAQMAASGSAILQQQQQLTTRCDSPPGFFDEECPHHAVSRAELRARTFTPRARSPQFHSCCVVGRTSAQLKPQSSLVTASANKIRFLAAASLRRRRDDDDDDDDNDGGYRGGGGGGGGSAGFKDLRHACDDDERATMLQMYNNQKHKEKSGSKSVTFRKTDGRSGARSHNRHHAQQHHQQQQNASVAASTVAGAAVAAAATGSLVVGRRLLCADPAAGGTLSRQQSLQGNPGIKIGPLTVRDVESVAGLKGVESLASLTRDCFIIPAEKIGRFLPIGMMN
ncbi:unnamed protein product [Notodromas monacha]|uniref:Uncharacterized protein n=1 Tax=Notodromas monacha TaxID=399045 RepID=A0A7R9GAL6_9CRUS|nr:unnamed protein product [Notodromas monacha]CAG0915564.1 unnamed protein product [Notodromas monacha]